MRLMIILSFICIYINASCQSDTIIWHNKSPLPATPRIDFGSFVIDSNYYIIGGIDGGSNWYSEIWKYIIPSDTWQRMRDFPGGPITTEAAFALNGHGYVCSGTDSIAGYSRDNEFWEYYPAVDTWQHKSNFPGASREAPISFIYKNKAVIGLGVGSDDLWQYDPLSDQWLQLSPPPLGSRSECGVAIIDSFAYFLGGFQSAEYNDIWRYSIMHDHWDSIGIMPGGHRANALFWAFDSLIIGGYGVLEDSLANTTLATDLYSYSAKNNKWDTLTCLNFIDSTADGSGAGSFVLGKSGFFFGGYQTLTPNFSMYNNMRSFDASKFLPTGIVTVENDASFKVYPNPVNSNADFSISTSESGDIIFYDALGRVIDERKLMRGINSIKLVTDNEIVFYRATLQYGAIENGKIVLIK